MSSKDTKPCILCHLDAVHLKCEKCKLSCCKTCFGKHHNYCKELLESNYHYCNSHNFQLVKSFCFDCNTLICQICQSGDHEKHSVLSFDNAVSKLKQDIKTNLGDFEKGDCALEEVIGILDKDLCALESRWKELVSSTKKVVVDQIQISVKEKYQLENPDEMLRKLESSKGYAKSPIVFLGRYTEVQHMINQYVKQQRMLQNNPHHLVAHVAAKLFNEPLDLSQIFRKILLKLDHDQCTNPLPSTGDHAEDQPASSLLSNGYDLVDELTDQMSTVSLNEKPTMEATETRAKDCMVDDFVAVGNDSLSFCNTSLCPNPACVILKKTNAYYERRIAAMSAKLEVRVEHKLKTNTDTQQKNTEVTMEDLRTVIRQRERQIYEQENEIEDSRTLLANNKTEHEILRQHNFEMQKALQSNQKKLQEEELIKQQLAQMKQYVRKIEKENEALSDSLESMRCLIKENEKRMLSLANEKDQLQLRLSSVAGNQLTKGNANITDLSDPNRPMKIGDQFVELYDNEWTDAIECAQSINSRFPDLKSSQIEEIVIRHLYRLIKVCYKECLAISQNQVDNIDKSVNDMILHVDDKHGSKDVSSLPGFKELMELRRQSSKKFADHLCEDKVMVNKINLKDWLYDQKNEDLVTLLIETPFFVKCVHLCWYMVIQDPVMHLDEELIPDTTYDKNLYREYTCSGKNVQFVVWPALFLHKEGPVLCKGVVQAYS